MNDKKFATAINCMDGRVQTPIIDWLKKKYDVDYVDMITEAGPNKILAEDKDYSAVESIKKRVAISVNHHGSNLIAVVGHYDCAGNPLNREAQAKQTDAAVKLIQSWQFHVQVIGLWVGKNWQVYR